MGNIQCMTCSGQLLNQRPLLCTPVDALLIFCSSRKSPEQLIIIVCICFTGFSESGSTILPSRLSWNWMSNVGPMLRCNWQSKQLGTFKLLEAGAEAQSLHLAPAVQSLKD